jgi:hypothetical protein
MPANIQNGSGGFYYTWGIADRLKAYRLENGTFSTRPIVNTGSFTGFPGGSISISANGETPGTAILWGVRGKRQSAGLAATTGPGVLVAFDANDITKQLWSSDDAGSDQLGVAIGDQVLRKGDVGWFARGASTELTSRADARGARYVLYAGEPTRDSLIQHGPFVAGSAVEIRELYRRFRTGDFISMSHIARTQRAEGTTDADLLDASLTRS